MASPPAVEPPGSPLDGPNFNNNNNQQAQEQPPPGVRKCGYLRKHKHGHKRFFVLRAPSDGAAAEEASPQPARLEYYESEKKWRSKSTAPKRAIALDSCLHIHKRADAKHKHLIALYTRDEYLALAAESEPEQEAWYQALTELLRESQAAGQGSPRRQLQLASCEDFTDGQLSGGGGQPSGVSAYREVWQVTLKPKGLGQSRNLTGVHRLCLAARTVGLVRLNCERPCVTLQLMNIRRCGHSDSFFFMELGRSASTGPGELWMQADDSVVAQNIHETILEAMRALRELAEFRPRSKSQSSSSSSSSGGATSGAAAAAAAGGCGGGGGLSAMCSRPISVPGRRHHHHPLSALPPSQTGLLRRSRTDTLVVAGNSNSRARTASEGDGCRIGSSAGSSPLSPDPGRTPLSRSHTLGAACCRLGGQTTMQPGRSLALAHSPSLVSKLTTEPGIFCQRPSSGSASGSPSDPASFMAFEDLGSSPAGDPRTFSSSSTASVHSDTPETPPGRQLDGYIAMDQGHFCHWPHLWESTGGDKFPRKRTYSLTTPVYQRPMPAPLSSASLDEYTLMQATLPTAEASSRATYTPDPEDYCDVDIGSGGTSSSSSSHLGRSGGGEEGYMPMGSGIVSVLPLQGGPDSDMSMSPTSVSAPQQILHPHPHKISSENSPDDSGYMRMWGAGTRLSGESPDGRLASGDYMNMSPLLLPPLHGSSTSASPVPSPSGFGAVGPGDQSSYVCCSLSHHVCRSQLNSLGEKKDSDQYVFMNSPAGRLHSTPKGESFLAICSRTMMSSPMRYSRTESCLSQRASSGQPNHLSLGLLLPSMNEQPIPNESLSPSGEPAKVGYPVAGDSSASSFVSGLNGQNGSLISTYMNLNFDGSQSAAISMGSLEEALMPGSCPSSGQPDKPYLKIEMEAPFLSSPSFEAGDYTEIAFTTTVSPAQPISQKPENSHITSPVAGLKRLTLSGVQSFIFASPPPDPNYGAKVIRADPQGRRRHSSETFSSTTTVTPVSPSFAHNPKRHNSASVENVSLRKNEGLVEEHNSSPMCRETSAGFQNGLNYIAVDVLDGDYLANGDQGKHKVRHPRHRGVNGTYTSIDFLAYNLKEASSVKDML
ncbi:insulin receptor substrate 2 isoform X2 [Rhineura floridana]|uniref:insulin receptor substrate 2 isoform X2 n=1 Tax=Rhineura floridana TaxID=261503 RepID=UPI002AC8098A|nr:insulin receptor substrate 2 isoform X2 [Rhineura floridana]